MLYKLKVIKPYYVADYHFIFNMYHPLTYVCILFMILASIVMSLVQTSAVQEFMDEIHDSIYMPDSHIGNTNLKWVKDFPEV